MWKCSKTPVIFEPGQEEFSRLVGWAGGTFHTEEFDLKAANWEEVYGGGRENASLPVYIADELIEALETAFALHAEAEEQAAADARDAEDYRYRYC
jgi:hypothetical protein